MAISRYCARCMSTFEADPVTCPNLGCGARRPEAGWGALLGAGDLIDRRYRVERPVAVGGAGLTYLAREVDDAGQAQGPQLAVKVLFQSRASGPFLKRLTTEFSILQELAHPNIVELHGFVTRAGHEPYLVTRFEEGGNLSQHVDRHGPLPGRVAAGVLRQILLALDTAHARGVIHRDLKPDNVLLRASTARPVIPEVRVADFGIAKVTGGHLQTNVTREGAFVGTPEYAAPEQFLGQAPTPATDVFAAGALLWFLLAARPPFQFRVRQDVDACLGELLGQLPVHLPPVRDASSDEQLVLQTVLDATMQERPEDRATIQRALQLLRPLVEPPALPTDGTLEITGRPAAPRDVVPPVPRPPDAGSLVDAPAPRLPSLGASQAPAADRVRVPPTTPPSAASTVDLPSDEAPRPGALPSPSGAPPTPPVPAREETSFLAMPPSAAPALPGPPRPLLEAAPTLEPLAGTAEPPTAEVPAPPAEAPVAPPAPATGVEVVPPAPRAPPPSSGDTPAPPPYRPPVRPAASAPSVEAAPRKAARAPAGPGVGAAAAGAAGCMGVSLLSTGLMVLLGLIVVAGALVVAAVVFRPTPVAGPIRVPRDERVVRFEQSSPLGPAGTQRVQRQIDALAPSLAEACGHPARVEAELLVVPSGQVLYARIGDGGLGQVDPRCLKRQLESVRLEVPPQREGIARVEFAL